MARAISAGPAEAGARETHRTWWLTSTMRGLLTTSRWQVGSLAVAGVVGTIAASAQSFVLAIVLGPEEFGSLVMMMAMLDVLRSIADPSIYEGTLRFATEYEKSGDRCAARGVALLAGVVDCVFALALVTGIAVFLWAGGDVLSAGLGAGVALTYAACSLTRPLSQASRVVLTMSGRPDLPQWLESATTILRAGVGTGMVLAGFGVEGLVGGWLVVGWIIPLWAARRAARLAQARWGDPSLQDVRAVVRHDARRLIRFTAMNNAATLLAIPAKQFDTIAVGFMVGPESAAFLRVAKAIAAWVGLVVAPLQAVAYPKLISARQNGLKVLGALARRLALCVGLPTATTALLFALVLPTVVDTVLGAGYAAAALPTALMFAGAAVWLAAFWVRPTLLARDLVGVTTAMTAAASCLAVFSYVAIVPRWGLVGHACVALISQIVVHVPAGIMALRAIPED